MSSDYNNPAFKKLLKKLQEESWQLELIISGFAIFGLFTAFEPLRVILKEAQNNDEVVKIILITIALIACSILIFNLLLHVILRGLWIGTLGLRYVSGDIDYDALKYSSKFTNYLKKKVGSFDKYIATLENYCSIIFAISFLLIFYVLALTFSILILASIATLIINNKDLNETFRSSLGIPLFIFMFLGMLLTFVDFASQGWLKKKKWTSKIYFPFYWIFSFITLSFLYRPLVYNFLDNKFSRRLSALLIPLFIILVVATSLRYKRSNYLNFLNSSNDLVANRDNYDNLIFNEDEFVKVATIPSKVITNNYLKVFIVFNDEVEDNVFEFNKNLVPLKDKRGLRSDIVIVDMLSRSDKDSLQRLYIKTFNEVYKTKIDSLGFPSNFIMSSNQKDQYGFETYLNIKNLSEGKHLLNIERSQIQKEDTVKYYLARIPFWYFPN